MTALPEVLEKLERATPGPWTNSVHNDAHMGRLYGAPLNDRSIPVICKTWNAPTDTGLCCYVGISQIQGMHNSAAIAAAVNFLREHGNALLAVDQDAKDAARYRWLKDGKIFAPQCDYPVAKSYRHGETLWGDALDAAIDAAMHAPGG